jgi:hypothetical protein
MNRTKKTRFKQEPNQLKRSPASDHSGKGIAPGRVDNRSAAAHQHQLMTNIDNSSHAIAQRYTQAQSESSQVMALQRQQIETAFGHSVQRLEAGEEEELLQGKLETVQRQAEMEDEELLQGRFDTAQRVDEEELLQGKFDTAQRQGGLEDEELLQGKTVASTNTSQLQKEDAAHGNSTGLPDSLKAGIESLSGMDISDVQVHRNSSKPAQLNALAYAQGHDIHLGPGQEKHLPHEAWHVVQQREGRVRPTMEVSGRPINDDASLEREADMMGEKAMQYKEP